MLFFVHYAENRNGPKHRDKRIKDHVDIIMTKTENIKQGKYLNKKINNSIVIVKMT